MSHQIAPLTSSNESHEPHTANVVQKRDFIDRIIAMTGARRTEARPIIEATLAQLGQVLSEGQTLAVPPLGRARIALEKDARGGDVITLRLRRRPVNLDPDTRKT
ncbi:MAG: DNA-binding protein [Alphaproteobacteria bacterium]|nr:DNA-binding protein [Alphaproteobacteria bacterium]